MWISIRYPPAPESCLLIHKAECSHDSRPSPIIMAPQTKEIHIADDPILINRDDEKEYSEHVEEAEDGKKGLRDIAYDDQENPELSRTGMRRLLKRNPSYNFIRDVAIADETPLDPAQVKRVSPVLLARLRTG
jgi:hypothetical protein